jgi:hypothetical protein
MLGNFPTNDDWIFVRQVEAFARGIFRLHAELDPSFVAQGFLGLAWGKLFGINFSSLRVLTFLITLLGLLFFVLLLKTLEIKRSLRCAAALLYFFNPLVFASAFTFMTDNYFLTFTVISAYFFVRYLKLRGSLFGVFLGATFVLFATLTRQIGIFAGCAFLLALLQDMFRGVTRKRDLFAFFLTALFSIGGYLISSSWPRFGANGMFILAEFLAKRRHYMLLSLHYFPLFVFPLFFGIAQIKGFSRAQLVLGGLISFVLGIFLYKYDFFPAGNVLYLEKLYTKSHFRSNFSIFDNIFFKVFFAGLISAALSLGILGIVPKISLRKLKVESIDLFLLFLGVGNFLILIIASDYYDRYFIPSFVCFLIFLVRRINNDFKFTRAVSLGLLLWIFISVSLQWEYHAQNKIKWSQVAKLSELTGLVTQIELNDTFVRYATTQRAQDYTGLASTQGAFTKKCFVQDYTLDSASVILNQLQEFEEFINDNIIARSKPYKVKKKKGLSRAKNNMDKFIFNDEYFSPLYNLVGKRSYVASWCLEDVVVSPEKLSP